MKDFYFTFKQGHPYADACTRVKATNQHEAMKVATFYFGMSWQNCLGSKPKELKEINKEGEIIHENK